MNEITKFESNPEIIQRYIKGAAFGKNKLIYLPLVIGIGLTLFIILAIFEGLVESIGIAVIGTLIAIAILCFILVICIHKSTLKKLKKETKLAPICIAKKVYGNDKENIYYCIYTCEEKRHDELFINEIAEKIRAIPNDTNHKAEKQIINLFQPDLAKPNEFAKKLPLSFTDGVIVWRKQFALGRLPKEKQQQIEENNKQFYVIAINPENAKIFNEI